MTVEWEDEPTREYPQLADARVLVAEDDPELRGLVAAKLRAEGCEVIEVGSGQAALDLITEHEPRAGLDLAILDFRMPGLTGLEVIYFLRTTDCSTPILLLTAFPEPDLVDECDRLNVPILQKPFPLHRIGAVAKNAMRAGGDW
jgi:DNA-binding response OmpR family regulator